MKSSQKMRDRVFSALTDRYVEFDVIVRGMAETDEVRWCEAIGQHLPTQEFRKEVMAALYALRKNGIEIGRAHV